MGHINVSLSEVLNETPFYSVFNKQEVGFCNKCNLETMQNYRETFKASPESKFLMIYSSLFSWTRRDSHGAKKNPSSLLMTLTTLS